MQIIIFYQIGARKVFMEKKHALQGTRDRNNRVVLKALQNQPFISTYRTFRNMRLNATHNPLIQRTIQDHDQIQMKRARTKSTKTHM